MRVEQLEDGRWVILDDEDEMIGGGYETEEDAYADFEWYHE